MSTLRLHPDPVKFIVNVFFREDDYLEKAYEALSEEFGAIEAMMQPVPFGHTTYYDREMGGSLKKGMCAFETLVARDALADIKHFCVALEARLGNVKRQSLERRANIDPGILLPEKFVLASGKNFPHRIYLGKGVYADLTLIYRHGRFEALPWTYTDYLDKHVLRFLSEAREGLIQSLRRMRQEKKERPQESND